MGNWIILFLIVWFAGTLAGTALAILIVRAGSQKDAPIPARAARADRDQAA